MNILVTGGGGYIGSHAVKRLLLDGHSVVVFDNFSRGYREPLEILGKYGELAVVEGDLRNKEDVAKVFFEHKIDAVMHFAALCLVDESMRQPGLYFENNVLGSLNLFEAMKESNVRKIIFSSTCAVYGEPEELPVTESHQRNPVNPYGESKKMVEDILGWYGVSQGLSYGILRYFNVCGADSEGEIGDSKKPSQLLVQNAVRGALGIEEFNLTCPEVDTPDGTPIRDYIDVEDLVIAHIKALEYLENGSKGDVFNLGSGKGWSVKEIVDAVKSKLGVDFPVASAGEKRQGEYAKVWAETSKAKDTLNFSTKKIVEDSVESLVKWYKNKPGGYE